MSDLADLLGFDPRSAPEKKEHLTNRILHRVLSETRSPRALTNGVHFDFSRLVQEGKVTQKDAAKLHMALVLGR